MTERSRTPYFIPRTAPPTKEGVAQMRREFYAALEAAGFRIVRDRDCVASSRKQELAPT